MLWPCINSSAAAVTHGSSRFMTGSSSLTFAFLPRVKSTHPFCCMSGCHLLKTQDFIQIAANLPKILQLFVSDLRPEKC